MDDRQQAHSVKGNEFKATNDSYILESIGTNQNDARLNEAEEHVLELEGQAGEFGSILTDAKEPAARSLQAAQAYDNIGKAMAEAEERAEEARNDAEASLMMTLIPTRGWRWPIHPKNRNCELQFPIPESEMNTPLQRANFPKIGPKNRESSDIRSPRQVIVSTWWIGHEAAFNSIIFTIHRRLRASHTALATRPHNQRPGRGRSTTRPWPPPTL